MSEAKPTPRTPVEISDTITPITAAVAPSFSPGTIVGMAAGNLSLSSVLHQLAA